ncbi:MAG: hypothetical protein O2985_18070 [Proteobacteria bacterium]|nr:hypothetical protein [Pseudomonadota bacterium]
METVDPSKIRPILNFKPILNVIAGLRKRHKVKNFDICEKESRNKKKYTDSLFSFLFYDRLNKKRFDQADLHVLKFVVFRSLKDEDRRHVGVFVNFIVRDWKAKGWVRDGDTVGTLALTKDGAEQVIRVNAGWRRDYFISDGPITSRGKVKIVSIICITIVLVSLIIAVTLIALDVIGIAGGVVETVTDPIGYITKKLPFFKDWF